MSMSSLSVAVSGLLSSQKALNTTAHNLSNVNTPGYVRQQVLLQDSDYLNIGSNGVSTLQVGLGTDIEAIRQVRDIFLDEAYREESSRQGFYEAQYQAVAELENIFGEIEGVSFSDILNDLFDSINELSKQPEGLETRGTFVQNAVAFIDRVNMITEQIANYQNNLNTQIEDTVDEINELGETIVELNEQISKYEAYGDRANDLRDERNNALDRLSELISITYKEDATGKVTVVAEGTSFVNEQDCEYLTLVQAEAGSSLLKPIWESTGTDVFNFDTEISLENNNDKGLLKGLLLSRGTGTANYTDMDDPVYYEQYIEPSIIMKTQAQFDLLVHEIVTTINDILAPNDGTGQLDSDAPYGLDGSQGTELFTRVYYDRYDGSGYYQVEDPTDTTSLYTAGNIMINPEILEDYNKIPLNLDPENINDNTIVEKIIDAWDEETLSLDPNDSPSLDFSDYYASFVGELGQEGNLAYGMLTNQETLIAQIDNSRAQLMGVSTDEELGNMMKYQHAYNASARVVSVVDEMMEHIINRLGVVGR